MKQVEKSNAPSTLLILSLVGDFQIYDLRVEILKQIIGYDDINALSPSKKAGERLSQELRALDLGGR